LKASARRRVALVEGSTPHMSGETENLLRRRLRIVALLLFVGLGAFLVWSLIRVPLAVNLGHERATFWSHVGVVALMGMLSWKLCGHCHLSLRTLRFVETLVFGVTAVFFCVLTYGRLVDAASLGNGHAHVSRISSSWMLLIFTYALFIPNTWRR